jgi:hypothetical protein
MPEKKSLSIPIRDPRINDPADRPQTTRCTSNPRMRFPAAVAILVLVAGCSSGSSTVLADVSDDEIERVAGTWVNQFGLVQTDPNEWRHRLTEACTEGVWSPEVAFELADRYLAEDRETYAGGDDAALPATTEAATALWTMAAQVCRDSFPAGAIDAGPP